MPCFLSATGLALAAAVFAFPAHASSVVTFEKDAGAITSLTYENGLTPPHYRDTLNGTWSEAGFSVAFDGHSSSYLTLDETLQATLYDAAWIDDCFGGCAGTPSLNRLSVTRTDGRPFTLDRIDIGSSYSAYVAQLYLVPEGSSMAQGYFASVPHINLALTGTRSDGSVVTSRLSTFDGLVPGAFATSGGYGSLTLDLTGAGLSDLMSLKIDQTFSFTFDTEVLAAIERTITAFNMPPLSDAMRAFLNRCVEGVAMTDYGTCYETVPGLGDMDISFDYWDRGSNRLSGFSIDALHFDGGVTPPAPVPLPLPAMALLGGLGALGLLRRFRRG